MWWMVWCRVRCGVWVGSRRWRSRPGVAGLAAGLAGAGTAVEVVACDSGNHDDVTRLVTRLAAASPPLSAVFHAAGIASSGLLQQTTPTDLATAMAAKAGGAAALDA